MMMQAMRSQARVSPHETRVACSSLNVKKVLALKPRHAGRSHCRGKTAICLRDTHSQKLIRGINQSHYACVVIPHRSLCLLYALRRVRILDRKTLNTAAWFAAALTVSR
eukprot:6543293-Pyramimonas_sp.AAC.1